MDNTLKETFLDCYLLTDKKPTYQEVSTKLNIEIDEVITLYNDPSNKKLFIKIQQLRLLHNSIKKISGTNYDFKGFKDFYLWYENTNKYCCYCGVSERILQNIWENGWRTKRKRGKRLEVERINTSLNLYNSNNCKLACYFCNNHKSDLITEEHYNKYFAVSMKNYLEEISKIKKIDND